MLVSNSFLRGIYVVQTGCGIVQDSIDGLPELSGSSPIAGGDIRVTHRFGQLRALEQHPVKMRVA